MNNDTAEVPFGPDLSGQATEPAAARRRRRRPVGPLTVLAAALAVGATALSGCAGSSPESIVPVAPAVSTPSGEALRADGLTTVFDYTGKIETLTVPPGTFSAHLVLAGGSGHDVGTVGGDYGGYGATVEGDLVVHPGGQVTVATGGAGQANNGNQSPGAGGWSLNDHYRGGRGGSGHGSQTSDGSGGGGASVIQVNGQTVVVAGGGGGQGGSVVKGGPGGAGGSAGAAAGHNGAPDGWETGDINGKGGSSAHPALDQNGHSYSGAELEGGGGGGGGGRYTGGGGQPSSIAGAGGGGGSSLYDSLTAVKTGNSSGGDGVVTITWAVTLPSNQTVTIARTGPQGPLMLEVPGGQKDPGVPVDVYAPPSNGSNANHQAWTFRATGPQDYGQFVNQQTGKCLEVNGTTGAVDQWDCTNEWNHLWRLVPNSGGGTALQVSLVDGHAHQPPGKYFLATEGSSDKVTSGTGLVLVTNQSDATAWTITAIGA